MLKFLEILTLNFVLIISIFSLHSYAFAQQYCIYQRDYMQHLCKIPGAQKACYAPDYNSKFPDYNSCENARRSALPNDMYWQRMTRCVPCGPPPQQPSYQQDQTQEDRAFFIIDKLSESALSYINELYRKYGSDASEEFHRKWGEFFQSRVIGKHVSQITPALLDELHQIYLQVDAKYRSKKEQYNKDHYKKILEQAYCSAYTSIKAAEMALRGNIEVSRNLMINLENMRATDGQLFEDNNILASCPKPEFNIPDVGMSIERDPRYIRYTEIVRTVQALIPKIETNFKELQRVQEKKKQTEQKIKEIETEIEQAKQKNNDELEKKARALLNQAEVENREALKKEQELLKEKLDIENKLAELKNKMLAEEKR